MANHERPAFPHVFYPSRNSKLLQSLADDIGNMVRKQSGIRSGGNEAKVVTYEDLLKDPEVMEAMKQTYGIVDEDKLLEDGDENDVLVDGKPRWAGKTMYELFKAEVERRNSIQNLKKTEEQNNATNVDVIQRSSSIPKAHTKQDGEIDSDSDLTSVSSSSRGSTSGEDVPGTPPPLSEPQDLPEPEMVQHEVNKEATGDNDKVVEVEGLEDQENVITVQHCVLEHQPLEDADLPRPLSPPDEFKSRSSKETTEVVPATTIASSLSDLSTSGLRAQERQRSEDRNEVVDVLPPALVPTAPVTSVLRDQNRDNSSEGELVPGLLAWLDHPAFLAACYCLALFHQLGQYGGLDFLSTLGVVLAMISMVSMLFL